MAIRQPIKNAASTSRTKPAAKPEAGEGLEALLQNTPQLRRVLLQAKERGGSLTFGQLNAALPPDFPLEQTEEFITKYARLSKAAKKTKAGEDAPAEQPAKA